MGFFSPRIIPVVLGILGFGGAAFGQAASSQPMASSSVMTPSSVENSGHWVAEPETPLDPASLVPDLPALPSSAKASLLGGIIEKLDRVQDEMTVQTFGGGKTKIFFDPRTHIFRDGMPAAISDLCKGDRVYVDTILDGNMVFARNVRLKAASSSGESQGIVTRYEANTGELQVRDELSPQPLKVFVTSHTKVIRDNHPSTSSNLTPGALVAVRFSPGQDYRDTAQEVTLLALPGASYTFAGRVAALDLHLNLVMLTSATDGKTYEIYLGQSRGGVDSALHVGASVTVLARFEGDRYVARSVTVSSPNEP